MIFNDFLSRMNCDASDPHKIIPVSFTMQAVLHARCKNIKHVYQVHLVTKTVASTFLKEITPVCVKPDLGIEYVITKQR